MYKIQDSQINMLSEALEKLNPDINVFPNNLITGGESEEFYLGLISGLLMAHLVYNQTIKDGTNYSQLLSVGAALAAKQYKNITEFPEFIDVD